MTVAGSSRPDAAADIIDDGQGAKTARLLHRRAGRSRHVATGLALAGAVTTAATALGGLADVSPLALSLLAGVSVGSLPAMSSLAGAGLQVARGGLLRLGVALLGFRLALESLLEVGVVPLLAVVAASALTFISVFLVARWMGLDAHLGLLMGAGFAICGASAVVAVAGVLDGDEEDVAYAAGITTVAGTISLFALPAAAATLGVTPEGLGFWAGASVNDVGQAVATASLGGAAALEVGVITKLARVVLLAPLLVLLGAAARRRSARTARGERSSRSPLPWFVIAFLIAGGLRSTGVLPDAIVEWARVLDGAFLGAGLFGVGAGVDLQVVRRAGARPLLLGSLAWSTVVMLGLAATVAVGQR